MATLILTYGEHVATLRPPDYPVILRPTRPQISNMTTGGRIISSNLRTSGTLRYPPFSWLRMPATEMSDFVGFIEDFVNRCQHPFQMTLWDGTVIPSIHYWDGIDGRQLLRPGNAYAVTVEFREVPS